MNILICICRALEYLFLSYFLLYNTINFIFILLSFFEVRRKVICKGFDDLDIIMNSPLTPPISIIVPCYNEEKTIVETINSLLNLEFPRIELVIVNDGSTDDTLEMVKTTFSFRRVEIDNIEYITTSQVKGYYQADTRSYDHVIRFVLVDKDNGGSKADAMNAGINASRCPYFVAIDADSIINERALLQAFRSILDHKDILAIGGQVAISNGCIVKDGKIIDIKLPKSWIVKFQIVEYIRSFTLSRTAFSRLRSLLIISGGFGIFEKEYIQKIGGYLTKYLTSKIALEYAGSQSDTVCEDLELIIRLHRYIREKKLPKTIAYLPHPLCWTQVPENFNDLSKQRNRWQRGLVETLIYHWKMLFNKKYGRIGLFGLPYLLFYELLSAPIEILGYITLPIIFIIDRLNFTYLLLFFIVSILYGVLISISSIIIGAWPEKTAETATSIKSLIHFKDLKEIFILLIFGFMENFGYRQITVWWRMKALFDYFKGKKDWDKFERIKYGKEMIGCEKDAISTE